MKHNLAIRALHAASVFAESHCNSILRGQVITNLTVRVSTALVLKQLLSFCLLSKPLEKKKILILNNDVKFSINLALINNRIGIKEVYSAW